MASGQRHRLAEVVLLTLGEDSGPADEAVPVASLHLRASASVPGLSSLEPSIPASSSSLLASIDAHTPRTAFSLSAPIGDDATEVACAFSLAGIHVRASGFGEVFVAADGRQIAWRPGDDLARQRPELVLGPGLVLALALQGAFCLHASAVLGPAGAVVFAGPSGAGKSTLAARLSERHGFRRLTDDISPFTADAAGCFLLPHFPQLKLPAESQQPASAAASHPVSRLYLLAECETDAPVRLEPVPPSVAALSVCGHIVASRLFPQRLTAEMLHATAAFAEIVDVRRLHYPKRPAAAADVARLLGAT